MGADAFLRGSGCCDPPRVGGQLSGGVHDRITGVSFSFREIRGRSQKKEVAGASLSSKASAWIPSREALIGMKLLPFRKTDTWDIFALCSPPVNVPEIIDFLRNWSKEEIANRMKEFLTRIMESGFRGSVKQTFAMTDDKAYNRQMNSARSFARELTLAVR